MNHAQKNGTENMDPAYPKPNQGPQLIQQFFDRKVDELLNLYDTTVAVSHQGEKGIFRELLIRGILGSVLPPHFGLGTGIVVDKWGVAEPSN
jgi:hypothetical protein